MEESWLEKAFPKNTGDWYKDGLDWLTERGFKSHGRGHMGEYYTRAFHSEDKNAHCFVTAQASHKVGNFCGVGWSFSVFYIDDSELEGSGETYRGSFYKNIGDAFGTVDVVVRRGLEFVNQHDKTEQLIAELVEKRRKETAEEQK